MRAVAGSETASPVAMAEARGSDEGNISLRDARGIAKAEDDESLALLSAAHLANLEDGG